MGAYWGLILFISVMVATPGPAKMVIVLGGAQLGFKRMLPFNSGLILGKVILNLTIGLGIAAVLLQYSQLLLGMKLLSASLIIYIAFNAWNFRGMESVAGGKVSHFSFLTGTMIHPLNPKGWAMVTLAWSNFGPSLGSLTHQVIVITGSFVLADIFFYAIWTFLGKFLGKTMNSSLLFNRLMIMATVFIVIGSLILI